MKITVTILLALFASASAHAVDIIEDVMKPLGRSAAFISRHKGNPAKAAEVLAEARNMVTYADLGLTIEPTTRSYVALGTAVGADAAKRKYFGLMEVLRTSTLQMRARAEAVPAGAACGDACGLLVDEQRVVQELGHSIFTDPEVP